MDRPSTSKPRGLCRYYNTPHGCFQRNNCKFLHGTEEKLTPYDKSKVCRFFAAGYCKRGEKCWFQHVLPDATTAPSPQSVPPPIAPEDAMCGICYEVPVTYGLLSDCGHIFCVECLRSWRDKKNKSDDVSFLNKKCPYCRTTSKLVIPSSHYYPHGHDGKAATLQKYKDSLSRVPCKYFTRSKPNNRFCPFGRDCLYQHRNADGTEFVFSRGSKYNLRRSGLRNRVFPGGFMENFPWGGDQEIVHWNEEDDSAVVEVMRMTAMLREHFVAGDAAAAPASAGTFPAIEPQHTAESEDDSTEAPAPTNLPRRFDLDFTTPHRPSSAASNNSLPSLESVSDSSDDEMDYRPARRDNRRPRWLHPLPSLRQVHVRVHAHGPPFTPARQPFNVPELAPTHPPSPSAGADTRPDQTEANVSPTEHAPVSAPLNDNLPLPPVDNPALEHASDPPAAQVIDAPAGEYPSAQGDRGAESPFMTDGRGRVVWSSAGGKNGDSAASSRAVAGADAGAMEVVEEVALADARVEE